MDLYGVLGVPRSASADEIDRAYRRLARRYHPGLNPGDRQSEERFRAVDAAYRVLGDRERRVAYDRRGTAPEPKPVVATAEVSFAGFDFSATADGSTATTFSELFADVFQDAARRAASPDRRLHIEATLPLAFEDALRGGRFPVTVVRQERCAACRGHGWLSATPRPCSDCGGAGVQRSARGHMVFSRPCDRCGGRGHQATELCGRCGGAGVQPLAERVLVQVPPGVEAGARLVVPGYGHAARGGAAGDLYVTVEVAAHRVFRRAGRDLLLTLPVAVHEAALGARVDVPTLDDPAKLRIPPGTASGQRFRLRGRGAPSAGDPSQAGDLLIEIQIVLPPVRDEQSKALLREFGRLNDVDVRKGLFDTLSSSG